MARIRTIKPEFWSDYSIARDLTRDQRLFYIGLWNEADDEGRFQAHPARLAGVLFPYDTDLHGGFIEDSLRALADSGRAQIYTVDGEPYGQLTKFSEHQRINRPTPSRIPPPPNDLEDAHGGLSEDSVRTHPRNREQGTGNREQGEAAREERTATAAAVGFFLDEVGVTWGLNQSINEWADALGAEAQYAGVDLPHEIRRCAEWHVEKGKKPKAPTSSIHNWLKRAADDLPKRTNGTRAKANQPYDRIKVVP